MSGGCKHVSLPTGHIHPVKCMYGPPAAAEVFRPPGEVVVQPSDPERQWIGAWHVPLNIAAMHVSGVLLCIGLASIPAVSPTTYDGPDDSPDLWVFGLMAWILMFHVAIQIPVGLLASRWAVRGQVFRATPVALGLTTSATWTLTWTFCLCADQDPSIWALCLQSWGCLGVSLTYPRHARLDGAIEDLQEGVATRDVSRREQTAQKAAVHSGRQKPSPPGPLAKPRAKSHLRLHPSAHPSGCATHGRTRLRNAALACGCPRY